MFNITSHQANVNQVHNEILPHACQNSYYLKKNIGEDMEILGPMHTVGGNSKLV